LPSVPPCTIACTTGISLTPASSGLAGSVDGRQRANHPRVQPRQRSGGVRAWLWIDRAFFARLLSPLLNSPLVPLACLLGLDCEPAPGQEPGQAYGCRRRRSAWPGRRRMTCPVRSPGRWSRVSRDDVGRRHPDSTFVVPHAVLASGVSSTFSIACAVSKFSSCRALCG